METEKTNQTQISFLDLAKRVIEREQRPLTADDVWKIAKSSGMDIEEPSNSEVLLPARGRDEVDWETLNRIAEDNPDFQHFIDCVVKSITINQVATVGFDEVLSDEDLETYVKKLKNKKDLHPKESGGEDT